jgi:hypothetical protein
VLPLHHQGLFYQILPLGPLGGERGKGPTHLSPSDQISMEIIHLTATVKEQLPPIHEKDLLPITFPCLQCFTSFPSTKCEILPHGWEKFIDKMDSQMPLEHCVLNGF